jgi:glycosyltransferase involved in cell wall biosynthesis
MLNSLILSFLNQDFHDSELCIVDDNSQDNTKEIVSQFQRKDSRIKYFYNDSNIGFSKNFLKSIMMSTGEFVVTLGDDDLLLRRDALRTYVKIFESFPDVYFVYSNLTQVDSNNAFDFAHRFFEKDILLASGKESLSQMWLRSMVISGMGLRKFNGIEQLYPKQDMLFPQVEFIGRILLNHSAYGVASYLCGFRAHEQQLGYFAIKGKRIKSYEQHSNIELFSIWKKLHEAAPETVPNKNIIEKHLISSFTTNVINEKIRVGNRRVTQNMLMLQERSLNARFSLPLWSSFIASILVPSRFLRVIKNQTKHLIINKFYKNEKDDFEKLEIGLG